MVWQVPRVKDAVAEFSREGGPDRFCKLTGLPLATYFSGVKIRRMLNNVSGARDLIKTGALLLGDVDNYGGDSDEGGKNYGLHLHPCQLLQSMLGLRNWFSSLCNYRLCKSDRAIKVQSGLHANAYHEVAMDFVNATAGMPDFKTPNGIAGIPLTPLVIEDFKNQMVISGVGPFLFPSDKNPSGHHKNLRTAWRKTLKRAGVPYFRISDLRSTDATWLSAGSVADK